MTRDSRMGPGVPATLGPLAVRLGPEFAALRLAATTGPPRPGPGPPGPGPQRPGAPGQPPVSR